MKGLILSLCLMLATTETVFANAPTARQSALVEIFVNRGHAYCATITKLYGSRWYRDLRQVCERMVLGEAGAAAAIIAGDMAAFAVQSELLVRDAQMFCGTISGTVGSPIRAKCSASRDAKLEVLKVALTKDVSVRGLRADDATVQGAIFAKSHVKDAVIYPWESETAYNAYIAAFNNLMTELALR